MTITMMMTLWYDSAWRWWDDTMTIVQTRWNDGLSRNRYRAIVIIIESENALKFTIAPSHHRVWVAGAMTRWRHYDEAMFYRAIVTVSSHNRHRNIALSTLSTCSVSNKMASDMNIHYVHRKIGSLLYSRNVNFPSLLVLKLLKRF